jgi:hypothetical protein
MDIIAFYTENNILSINSLCGENAELLSVKADGVCSYHLVVNG